jgi:hypothetical protein
MNKKLIVTVGIAIVLMGMFTFFYLNNSEDITGQVTSSFSETKEFQGDISELIFKSSDFPEGYKVISKGPRVKSDIVDLGISLGWIEGYQISFARGDGTLFDATTISQVVSRYPLENVSLILEMKEEGYTKEILSNPNIGDVSLASKITEESFGIGIYRIEFAKKDIYVALDTMGDYELLKELAKKIEKKI